MQVMKNPINRIQTEIINRLAKKSPIVAVVGARQVGKTTLVRKMIKDKRVYHTFDDSADVLNAKENPHSFLTYNERLTIDEVQKLPSILPVIKRIVDELRSPGQFIITGSANITMLPKISETLAGRIMFVDIYPLSIYELTNSAHLEKPNAVKIVSCGTIKKCENLISSLKPKNIRLEKMVLRGGYPSAWLENDDTARHEWFKGYVRTYLERDVRDLSHIHRLYDYQKFISLASLRCSQLLSRADLARDSGISYSTANNYFDLLIATFQIFLLEPYFSNIGKRLIKSPKLMWSDTGLAMYLQGLNTWHDAERLGRASFLVENKVALEVKTLLSAYLPLAKMFYWRTGAGAEIDLLVENNGHIVPIEIKWKENVGLKDIVSMDIFLKDFKNTAPFGLILYNGKNLLKLRPNVFAIPFNYFFG